MAVFTPDTVGNINDLKDIKRIQEYLYRLTEQLQYVLRNLTPQDNDASNVPSLTYATGQTVKVVVDGNELDIVLASEVIKAINESIENAKINPGKVNINGVSSTGSKFAVSALGVPSISDGTISSTDISGGTITGADISGGTIDDATITDGTMSSTSISDATVTDTDHQSGKVGPFDVDASGISGTNVSIPDTGNASLAELTLADAFWNGQTVTQICQTMWNALFP
jgi:hypothetical protein